VKKFRSVLLEARGKTLWGGQSWPQPPFQAAGPAGKRVRGHDCPPHNPVRIEFFTDPQV